MASRRRRDSNKPNLTETVSVGCSKAGLSGCRRTQDGADKHGIRCMSPGANGEAADGWSAPHPSLRSGYSSWDCFTGLSLGTSVTPSDAIFEGGGCGRMPIRRAFDS